MLWSYALAIIGVTALRLIGKKRGEGFILGAFAQILWIVYAIVTAQFGFIIAACFYFWAYTQGYLDWSKNSEVQKVDSNV